MLGVFETPGEGGETDLDAPLARVAEIQNNRGLFVLITDLLAPVDKLHERLRLRARGHDVAILQVLDPTEVEPDFDQPLQLHDLETGIVMPVDVSREIGNYRKRFQQHEAEVRDICAQAGIDFLTTTTNLPFEFILREFLANRSVAVSSSAVNARVNSRVRL